jgi:hypothetical protein
VGKVMIVMFRNEEHPVHDRHSLIQSRVQGRVLHLFGRKCFETLNQDGARRSQVIEDGFDGPTVVLCPLGGRVAHIGR